MLFFSHLIFLGKFFLSSLLYYGMNNYPMSIKMVDKVMIL